MKAVRLIGVASLVFSIACQGNALNPNDPDGDGGLPNGEDVGDNVYVGPDGVPQPFSPLSPRAYTTKVKTLLTGLPPTDAEVARVKADPSAIKGLVAEWQQLPEYQPKLIKFLGNAFQQTQVADSDFVDQGVLVDVRTLGAAPSAMLLANLRESFARTALAIDAAGEPFQTTMSTQKFMMTPPLATYYAVLDTANLADAAVPRNLNTLAAALRAFTPADYANWRIVTVRMPNAGEATTTPAAAGAATELVLNVPRQGFWSTPAFFAGWQTNVANKARVTLNQILIVALNRSVDGTDVTKPISTDAVDVEHAAPGTPCYNCHLTLDPMKQFLRQAYTIHFSRQADPNMTKLPGMFASFGVSKPGTATPTGIYDFGKNFAEHPDMPKAWVQKLCTYANDAPCSTSDPAFTAIADQFARDGSFKNLVVNLFSSPIVTYASPTKTSQSLGMSFPISKADHLCWTLSNRLKLPDACRQAPGLTVAAGSPDATIQTIANILPANGYSRGNVRPVLANDPTLFFRAGLENVCALLSARVIDVAGSGYTSTDAATTVSNLVHNFMGVGAGDDADLIKILTDHFNAATATGVAAADAMKSTFMAACMSPSVVGIGQ
jgi:hypothetical protein